MRKRLYPELPVMLVDDEDHILLAFETELRGAGITNTVTCNDSREVVSRISRQRIGVMLLDLSMPKTTGIEFSKKLFESRPNIPTIICSGFSEQIRDGNTAELGNREYVMKPMLMSELAQKIRKILEPQ